MLNRKVQWLCLDVSILLNLISLYLLFNWDSFLNYNFQIITKSLLNNSFFNLLLNQNIGKFIFAWDQLSIIFIIITTFLFPIAIISMWNTKLNYSIIFFYLLLFILEINLIMAFLSVDLFYFYIFFEVLTIPTFFLLYLYGEHITKIRASFLFIIYSLTSSSFLTGGICFLLLDFKTTNVIKILSISAKENYLNSLYSPEHLNFIWILIFIGFAIKLPLIPFHIWLPEAHAEAPTGVSIILAGVILKLGGYGIYRFLIPMYIAYSFFFTWVYIICLFGIIFITFICLKKQNLKQLIAYSSINHMSVSTLGLISNTKNGITGGIYMMIQHSLAAPCFFFLAGVLYEKYNTYNINFFNNLYNTMPLFSVIFFFSCLINIAFPLTGAFIGEFITSLGLIKINLFVLFIFLLNSLLSSFYSFWLFNKVIFSEFNIKFNVNKNLILNLDIARHFYFFTSLLILLSIIIGVFPSSLLNWLSLGEQLIK